MIRPSSGKGGKHGQPRPEDDPCAAGERRPPIPTARRLAEFAVQTDQPGGRKTRRNASFELRREVDLGDQKQNLSPSRQRGVD